MPAATSPVITCVFEYKSDTNNKTVDFDTGKTERALSTVPQSRNSGT